MKISVGHVLLIAGVGTYVVLGPLDGADKATIFMSRARNVAADKLPYMEFLRTSKPKEKKTEVAAPVDVPAAVADKIPAGEARVKIGDQEATAKIAEGATSVTLELDLKPTGHVQLQTWLTQAEGKSRGAYYTTVRLK